MPYLTPDDLPGERDCRALLIPASSDWLAIVSGALTELIAKYNWQQFGSVTVDDAVDAMQAMIDNYYDGCTGGCELPGGGSIIRIGDDGKIEELIDGAWAAPTGDYIIPPPEAREGGTEADRKCLAAANATNVLEQLYESLSESWAEHLAEAEAVLAFTGALTGIVGFSFAPITFGIYAFFAPIFAAVYVALEYLTADLWDEAFSDQIRCFLYDCAEDDAGVITFDWDCFTGKLNSLTDEFGLSELQIRLYLQVAYMMYFIGGSDGLNLAGRTTEIETADCADCGDCPEITDWVFRNSSTGDEITPHVTYLGNSGYEIETSLPYGGDNYWWLGRSDPTAQFNMSEINMPITPPGGQSYWTYDGTFHSHSGHPEGINVVRWYAAWDNGIGVQTASFIACPVPG